MAVLAHATTPVADLILAANDAPAPVTWKKVTEENLPFTVAAGGQKARFGAGTKWIELFLQAGTYVCAQPATFPSDPAPGVYKECDVLTASVPAPAPSPAAARAPSPAPTPVPAVAPAPAPALAPSPAPAGSLQVTRTSCTAPCAVLFDATAMGDFRATYSFDFGDPNAGTWPVSGKSKNSEVGGPIAAHVFNTPAVYTPKVNGVAVTITVADPNVVYAGAKTICVSAAKDYAGCPTGAAQQTAMPNGTGWNGKRVLLRAGEKFGDISVLDGNASVQIGAYGVGAKPVVASVGIGNWQPQTAAFPTDITVMDLNVSNQISQSLGSRVLVLRNDVHLTPNSGGIALTMGELDYWYRGDPNRKVAQSAFYNAHEIFFVENNALGADTKTGMAGFWGDGSRIALLGNRFGRYQQHSARFSALHKSVLAHNEFQGISADGMRVALKLHSMGDTRTYTDGWINDTSGRGGWLSEQIVIANNVFGNPADNNVWTVAIGPQNATVEECVRDVIVENNKFLRGPKTATDLVMTGKSFTLRGNGAITTGNDNGVLPKECLGPYFVDK